MILLAVLASVLPLKAPNFQDYSSVNIGPSARHLLGHRRPGPRPVGTHHLRVTGVARHRLRPGRSSAWWWAGMAGLLAGYRSGPADTVLNAVSFVLLAFPACSRSW